MGRGDMLRREASHPGRSGGGVGGWWGGITQIVHEVGELEIWEKWTGLKNACKKRTKNMPNMKSGPAPSASPRAPAQTSPMHAAASGLACGSLVDTAHAARLRLAQPSASFHPQSDRPGFTPKHNVSHSIFSKCFVRSGLVRGEYVRPVLIPGSLSPHEREV